MKKLKDDVKELFKNEKELQWICREMQKTVLWHIEGTITMSLCIFT